VRSVCDLRKKKRRLDCSDPVNVRIQGMSHNDVPKDPGLFRMVAEFLMERHPGLP